MGDHVVDGGPATWYDSDHECSDWEHIDSGRNLEQLHTRVDIGYGTGGKLQIYSISSDTFHHGYNSDGSFTRCYVYILSLLKNNRRLLLGGTPRTDSPILLKYSLLISLGNRNVLLSIKAKRVGLSKDPTNGSLNIAMCLTVISAASIATGVSC